MLYNDNNLSLPQMVYYNKCKMKELMDKMEELLPKRYIVTIPAGNWVRVNNAWEVTITTLKVDKNVVLLMPEDVEDKNVQLQILSNFRLINEVANDSNGYIVLRCYATKPSIDINVNIITIIYEEVD